MLHNWPRPTMLGIVLCGVLSFGAPALAADTTTLSFPTWQAEEPGFADFWKESTKAFESANPGVHIDLQQIPYKEFNDQMTIRFAAGTPPDIVELSATSFPSYANQGWLEPLDSRIKGTPIETQWSSLQKDMVWDGKTEGVLVMGYGFMMFYNDLLLKQAGVGVPTNLDEFADAVAKITDKSKGIFGLSATTTEHPNLLLEFNQFLIWQGADFIKDGQYNLHDPKVIAAVERFRKIFAPNAPVGINSTLAREFFSDGKAGFLIDGPWVWGDHAKAAPALRDHLKMVKAPFSPPVGGAANSLHLAVATDSRKKDLVWKYYMMIAEPKWQERYTILTSSPPGRRNVLSEETKKDRPDLVAINEAVDGAVPAVPRVAAIRTNYNEYVVTVDRAAVQILTTNRPVQDLLADLQTQLEKIAPLKGANH
jgi:multiple sugar transport system substrate-binding protein